MRRVGSSKESSVYIHVPFCAHKCEYCAFFSELAQHDLIRRYANALAVELELVGLEAAPKTIFFGGGTPSLLSIKYWESILTTMQRLGLTPAGEWTVECNPATVSADKARLLREFGVSRISMGVQSLNAGLLDRLGRVHSREMVFRSYDILRSAEFENVNLDLMFAIPGQTMSVWKQTLSEVAAMESEHLSCYEVIYEEDTPLFEQLKAGQFDVDDDLADAMYWELVDIAAAAGFHQYEIANFAKGPVLKHDGLPRFACRHNVNYWQGGSYLGLGPSASEYVGGLRSKNWSNTQLYCERLESGRRAIESHENLSPLARAGETAAFGLRMNQGLNFKSFAATTGFELPEEWSKEMNALVEKGWAARSRIGFRLTPAGLRFADAAGAEFLRPNANRETNREVLNANREIREIRETI